MLANLLHNIIQEMNHSHCVHSIWIQSLQMPGHWKLGKSHCSGRSAPLSDNCKSQWLSPLNFRTGLSRLLWPGFQGGPALHCLCLLSLFKALKPDSCCSSGFETFKLTKWAVFWNLQGRRLLSFFFWRLLLPLQTKLMLLPSDGGRELHLRFLYDRIFFATWDRYRRLTIILRVIMRIIMRMMMAMVMAMMMMGRWSRISGFFMIRIFLQQ